MSDLKAISESYYDMHGESIPVLSEPPSPLEFARLVHTSRPVVIRNSTVPIKLGNKWTDTYLSRTMGDLPISVAVTPHGRADSVTLHESGKRYFVEPHVQSMTMAELLIAVQSPADQRKEIHYLQSQNGNIYSNQFFADGEESDPSEFQPLRADIPAEISWCSEALGHPPDAVNLWIGDDSSITSVHSDPYENIYQVVRGCKHFTLLPPTDSWALKERRWDHAKYCRRSKDDELELVPSEDGQTIRWSSIQDPTLADAFPEEVHPLEITLLAGDTMYLPAGYWHYVRQSGLTVALNYWYDVDMGSLSWQFVRFLRDSCDVPRADEEDESE